MATKKGAVNSTAKKTVKKATHALGPGGLAIIVVTLLLSLALGAGVAATLTRNDGFTHGRGADERTLTVGEVYSASDLVGDFTATHLGRDVTEKVQITPSFTWGEDGEISFEEECVVYVVYTVPVLFGLSQVEYVVTYTVVIGEGGNA